MDIILIRRAEKRSGFRCNHTVTHTHTQTNIGDGLDSYQRQRDPYELSAADVSAALCICLNVCAYAVAISSRTRQRSLCSSSVCLANFFRVCERRTRISNRRCHTNTTTTNALKHTQANARTHVIQLNVLLMRIARRGMGGGGGGFGGLFVVINW